MRKPSRGVLLAVVATLVLGILAACGGSKDASDDQQQGGASSSAGSAPEQVTLSLLVTNQQERIDMFNALIEAFEQKYPHINIEMETRPAGTEGDNIVKTRLSTGDMNDLFYYNSGALMQTLNPEQNLVDLTDEPFMANVTDSFKKTVSYKGRVYGVPVGSSTGGGWLYNKKVYEDLGLSVPKTWAELMENNEKIKEAGLIPVIGTFKETWTAQLIILSDYYNLQAEYPTFAEEYTANKAKFATTPAALRGFEKLREIYDRGFWNEDFLATTYDAGQRLLAEGKGAHYPMQTRVIASLKQNYPDQLDNIGFFPQPSDSPDINGITVWMPNALFIYKNTEHPEEAKLFLEFAASKEGVEATAKGAVPYGPWMIKGVELPEDVPQMVKDMLPYFNEGKTAPALEFLSPVKGPNLEHIAVEVGAGMKTAREGAEMYDKDVEKQAQQLGLEGW